VLSLQGTNITVAAADEEPLWSYSAAYTWTAVDRTLQVSSTSANDTLLGSGAQRVRIWWLNAAGVEATVDVDMAGAGAAPTGVVTARRVNRVEVIQVGVTGSNEGNVVVYYLDGAPVYQGYVPIGRNVNDGLIQTVPAGKQDNIAEWTFAVANSTIGARLYTRLSPTSPWLCTALARLGETGWIQYIYDHPIQIPAGSDYVVMVLSSASPGYATGTLFGWREDV
jgi:hypothetical protein